MTEQHNNTLLSTAPINTSTEAGAVVFTQLYGTKDGSTVQFNLTIRADTGIKAIDEIINTIKYAKEKYRLDTVMTKSASTKTEAKPVDNSAPIPGENPATEHKNPLENQAHTAPSAQQVIYATKIEIIPSSEGKPTVKWYADGHQYPDIYTTKSVDKLVELLALTGDWKPIHFEKAVKSACKHKITWVNSENLNKNGKPYKNIVAIEPY